MMYLSIRTFSRHQDYQFDNPGFVKLKTKLLFDDEFAALSEQAQLLYLKLLLHAAFTANKLPDSLEWMAGKLSMPTLAQSSIDELKEEGYLVDYDPDAPVVPGKPDGEGETGEKKTTKKRDLQSIYDDPGFQKIWDTHPRKDAKVRAAETYAKLVKSKAITPELIDTIVAALEAKKRDWKDPQFIPLLSSWLNGKRWEDGGVAEQSKPTGPRPINLRVAL